MPQGRDDSAFRQWYADKAARYGLSSDPDAPDQFYDYRAAFRAGATPDATGHWPSDFKRPGHPNMVVGGFHVQTGQRVPGTPRARSVDELVALGWDADTAKGLMAMPEPRSPRTLSEQEFNAARDKALASLPKGLREDEFQRLIGPAMEQALGEAENTDPTPEGSAAGRFVGGIVDMLNPIAATKGMIQASMHPVEAVKSIVGAQVAQGQQAIDAGRAGRYAEAVGRTTATALPILGPIAARAGEQIAAGDVAGGLGKGVGLVAPIGIDAAISARGASQAARAPLLEREAVQQVAGQVLAPGNPAFRGRAQAIAPRILEKMTGGRPELQQAAVEGMADAATRIDDAVEAAGGVTAPIAASEVIGAIRTRIAELQDSAGSALSDAAQIRIDALKKRITQVQSLAGRKGTVMYEDLKKLRDENYRLADEARGYQKQGNPIMADEGWAARETGSAIRDVFARRSPETAAANADYTFFKTLNDILDPAIGRPKNMAPTQGVTGGTRVSAAVAGSLIGPKTALLMGTVIPWLKGKMAEGAWQLADAQSKMKLAKALRSGEEGAIRSAMAGFAKYVKPTSPTAPQRQPAEALP